MTFLENQGGYMGGKNRDGITVDWLAIHHNLSNEL
jgi:hypothetical protein